MTTQETRRLARELADMKRRLTSVERTPQLAHSSIDDYALPVYDSGGEVVAKVGKQDDGTWGAPPLKGPIPPSPMGVSAIGGPGSVTVVWSGDYAEGVSAPLDFDTLEVLVDDALAGAIPNRDGGTVTISALEGTRYVSARVRTLVPRHSSTTSPFSVEVGPPADQLFVEAGERIEAAEGQIQQAKDDLATERQDRIAALEEAERALQELQDQLEGIADSEELQGLRDQIAAAQEAVADAQADATAAKITADAAAAEAAAAQSTADDAAASALAAAGIAADKGRILYQPDEPTGDDRSPNNLWIDSDNGKVFVWNGSSWEESQSEDLRDAAQAAVVAQQTAEAADAKAQSAAQAAAAADTKATEAQNAAQAAQDAAQAAQQTADQATLDAANAHNAAVEAQERADSIRADLANGPSLWEDPSFERSRGGLPGPGEDDLYPGRIERSQEWAATGEWSVKYIASGAGGNNYGSYGFGTLTPGRWYAVSATAHAADHEQIWNTTWDVRTEPTMGGTLIEYVISGVDGRITVGPGETATKTWYFQAPEGATGYRFWAGQIAQYNGPANEGEVVYLDDFRLVDVTDSYPQYLAAQQAADEAKARAEDAYALAETKATMAEVQTAITTSANGKNAITVSSAAPSSSTPGVVTGDTWWRVDGSGQIFGQWRWTGSSWTPVTVRSEVIANLDVGKLTVTGSSRFTTAVVDRLFADIFTAHKITANEVLIGGALNLIPGVRPGSNYGLSSFTWDETEKALRTTGRTGIYSDEFFTLPPGDYLVSADIKASVGGTRSYVGLMGGSDVSWSYRYGISNVLVPTDWQHFEADLAIPEGDEGTVKLRILPAYSGDSTATTWYRNVSIRPKVGSVLIKNGSIGADKIMTEEVAASIATVMQLAVENLVVTEGATINEAVIKKLAAQMVTAGVIRTAETGQRVVIDESGIVMYGVDEDNVEFELVRIGPTGENLITAGDTTISPDGVQAPSGDFDTLAIGGSDLSEILWPFPRGVVARGWNDIHNRSVGPKGYTELGEITVPVEDGRAYSLKVEPFSVYLPRGGRLGFQIYIEKGYNGNSAPSPTTSSRLYRVIVSRDTGGDRPMEIFQGNWLAWEDEGATEWRLLFVLDAYDSDDAGTVYAAVRPASSALAVSVEDIGPHVEDIMTNRTGTTAAPKPPPPAPKRYTKTYTSTEFYTYNQSGSQYSSNTDVVQGLYAGGSSGVRRRGGWKFPSMTGDLSGATIEKVEMYIYLNHSYYTAGATVNPAVHNGNISNSLAPFTSIYNWKRNTGKWITLKPELYNGFKSGAYQGVGVISTNTYAEQYARFNGKGAKIRITYVK